MNLPVGEATLTPKQERQLQKQQRRKKYADLAIQGTNNSSIASKRSVEILYGNHLKTNSDVDSKKAAKEYFKYFVAKAPKRSPCINRGYWLRLQAIRSALDKIVEGTNKHIIVINLGCGFDPLPFQLLDKENAGSQQYIGRLSFLDLDYADLIERKTEIIRKNAELMKILDLECEENYNKQELISDKYTAIPCNLNHPDAFAELLQREGLSDPNVITVFIAEVSLAYMKPDQADTVIATCSRLPSSHFLLLEQIMPQGPYEPFSKQMLKHFTKNDSPLLSVLKYNTAISQRQRFSNLGFPFIEEGDMYQLWRAVDPSLRSAVEKIEPFDELEEFQLFSHHYIILHATNYEVNFGNMFDKQVALTSFPSVDARFQTLTHSIDTKFGSIIFDDENQSILYFGGCNPCRVSDLLSINPVDGSKKLLGPSNSPPARMCHTWTSSGDQSLSLLVGGRKAPSQGFNDTWLFDHKMKAWNRGPDLPETRYRHCSALISEDQLLIFGGETSGDQFLKFDFSTKQIKSCQVINGIIGSGESLISPAMDYRLSSNKGVLFGGSSDGTKVADSLYIFTVSGEQISVLKQLSHPLFKRYGAKVLFLNDEEILIAGGTSPDCLFGKSNTIIIFNMRTESIKEVPIKIWEDYAFFLVGFEMLLLAENEVLVVGGGATCYGFGSVWNQGFKISF